MSRRSSGQLTKIGRPREEEATTSLTRTDFSGGGSRDNWLSNRIFKSYEDILDHCCFAWNKLIDQPWRIMSIGLRDWAHAS